MARLSRDKIDVAVNDWAKSVVRKSRAALSREKGISTKRLWASIRYRYIKKTITFSMEEYGAYLDKGVTGTGQLRSFSGPRGGTRTVKNTPVAYNKSEADPEYSFKSKYMAIGGDLNTWLKKKNLPQSLGFVIRRSIHARGIRPRRFFSDVFKQSLPEFDVILEEATTVSVEETLDEILKPLKQN